MRKDCLGREVRWLRSSKCFEESEEREEIARLGGESYYLKQTKEVSCEQSWVWLQNGELKRETESKY